MLKVLGALGLEASGSAAKVYGEGEGCHLQSLELRFANMLVIVKLALSLSLNNPKNSPLWDPLYKPPLRNLDPKPQILIPKPYMTPFKEFRLWLMLRDPCEFSAESRSLQRLRQEGRLKI